MNSKQDKGMAWVGPMATSKLLGLPIPTSKKMPLTAYCYWTDIYLGGGGGEQ